jgi:hypothetical protein
VDSCRLAALGGGEPNEQFRLGLQNLSRGRERADPPGAQGRLPSDQKASSCRA